MVARSAIRCGVDSIAMAAALVSEALRLSRRRMPRLRGGEFARAIRAGGATGSAASGTP